MAAFTGGLDQADEYLLLIGPSLSVTGRRAETVVSSTGLAYPDDYSVITSPLSVANRLPGIGGGGGGASGVKVLKGGQWVAF